MFVLCQWVTTQQSIIVDASSELTRTNVKPPCNSAKSPTTSPVFLYVRLFAEILPKPELGAWSLEFGVGPLAYDS